MFTMPKVKKSSRIRQARNIFLLTVIFGAAILTTFRLIFSNTVVSEVLQITTIVSFVSAVAVVKLQVRREKGSEKNDS